MTLLCDLDSIPSEATGGVISIGNFDGVHRGHAELLSRLKSMASVGGGPTVAITFDPHPASILRPEHAPIPLTTIERRAQLLGRQGIDFVIACRPTRELLNLTADQFFDRVLLEKLSMRGIVEGPNFFFGRDRQGDTTTLKRLCSEQGIQIEIVDPQEIRGEMVSSSLIRKLIANGDLSDAGNLLTAAYEISGRVSAGAGRGKDLGIPTANLVEIPTVVPGPGVYSGQCLVDSRAYRAAVNIGPNPTFEEGGCKVEVHLLDFSGDLYERSLSVELHERIRDVVRFDSVDALLAQVQSDIDAIREMPLTQ